MSKVKVQLYHLCKEYIDKAISEIERVITERREAMHNETKSSMGDKYETTREMLQQDINMNIERLNKAKQDLATLQRIEPNNSTEIINEGSLVLTNNGNFYLSVSAGKYKVDGLLYYAVSVLSPIGQQLVNKKEKAIFRLNGKEYIINNVF